MRNGGWAFAAENRSGAPFRAKVDARLLGETVLLRQAALTPSPLARGRQLGRGNPFSC